MTTTTTTIAALSLLVCGALCYPGRLMDEVPRGHRDRLRLLELAVALNEQWSPVWSERLTRDAVRGQPNPRICAQLVPDDLVADEEHDDAAPPLQLEEEEEEEEEDNTVPVTHVEEAEAAAESYGPFGMVTRIVDECWYSGSFVAYGARLLGHATNCLFYRHALLHLAAVERLVQRRVGQRFNELLRSLSADYRALAGTLSAVGVPIRRLLQLATFFDDVDKLTPVVWGRPGARADDAKNQIRDVLGRLRSDLTSYRSRYCAVVATAWYDADQRETVELSLTGGPSEPEPAAAAAAADGKKPSPTMTRVERLRALMRRVFDGLHVAGMSPQIWDEIFANNVLVKASDLGKATAAGGPAAKNGKAVKRIGYDL